MPHSKMRIICRRKIKKSINGADKIHSKESIELANSMLSTKSNKEISEILKNIDFFSSLNKVELTNLVSSNQEAVERLRTQAKRESLEKMTTKEIKILLKDVQGISKFKKSQLIEMVLSKGKKKEI